MLKLVNKAFRGAERWQTATEMSSYYNRNKSSIVYIANGGERLVDACVVSPLAALDDAPILLTKYESLPEATYIELKRMKPSKVVIVGGNQLAVSDEAEASIREACPSATIQRIGGYDRHETCFFVAQELEKRKAIDTIYIIGDEDASADGLSIAPVAGMNNQPILIVKYDSIPNEIYNWLKSKNITTCYLVGGTTKVSDQTARELSNILNIDVLSNRISGADRKETNAGIIKKFFPDKNLEAIFLTKAWELVDSATAGPLAAQKRGPIILCDDNISQLQLDALTGKSVKTIYEVGGGISQIAANKIREILGGNGEDEFAPIPPPQPEIPRPTATKAIITFLNVADGLCCLIEDGGKNYLIDTGEEGTIAKYKTIEYLKKRNIAKIDYIFITHFHSDHCAQAPEFIENFSVSKIYIRTPDWNRLPEIEKEWKTKEHYNNMINAIRNKNIEIKEAKDNEVIALSNNSTIKVFNAKGDDYSNYNSLSLAFLYTKGSSKIFISGDITDYVEKQIASSVGNVNFMLVPHHGYRGSTSDVLLKALRPTDCFMCTYDDTSVAKKETVKRIKETIGANVYSSVSNGNMICETDGSYIKHYANTKL